MCENLDHIVRPSHDDAHIHRSLGLVFVAVCDALVEDPNWKALLESGTPREPKAEADRARSSVGGHIAHSTITGRPVASGVGHAPAHSGAHT